MENDSIFYSTIIENIPIPILIIEILEYPNKISFKTVNRAFKELNLEYIVIPIEDIRSKDIIVEKFTEEKSKKNFDIVMGVIFNLLKRPIGSQEKRIIDLEKKKIINELKSAISPESENLAPCEYSFFKINDSTIGITFNILKDNGTEKREKEIALLQSHRLASVGDLAAGFAHEINNPLFGIINYCYLIKESIDEGLSIDKNSEEYEFLLGIIEESQRISKMIGNLSEFSRKGEEKDFTAIKITDIIEKVVKLLSYKIKRNQINVEKKIDENFPTLMLQQYRIEHCLFNLMLNSIDALENIKDRVKIIRITSTVIESDNKRDLEILFYDNGVGILAENLPQIFTPFFTTQKEKKGAGLGLYTVQNIITSELDGEITVNSKNDEWTEFKIVIPLKGFTEDENETKLFL